MKKRKRPQRASTNGSSPVRLLQDELVALRRDLRSTARAYTARLEVELAEARAAIAAEAPADNLSGERLHHIRSLTSLVRDRNVKPEKGRRKDLRKLDTLIGDLHEMTHPGAAR